MRARIAATAHTLFQTEGYRAISMRKLARHVGCTPMTLYKYYDNKTSILRVLWTQIFDTLFDELEHLTANESDPKQRLHIMARAYVKYWLDHADHYRMVFMVDGITQPDVSIFIGDTQILQRYAVLFTTLSQVIGEDNDLKLKTDVLMCSLHGIAHNLITISGYDWTCYEKLVDIALAGILHTD